MFAFALLGSNGYALAANAPDNSTPAVFSTLPQQAPYQAAWKAMLHNEPQVPGWIRTADATSTEYTTVQIGQERYLSGFMCKPHDCGNHRFYGMFSADRHHAWGLQVSIADRPGALEMPSAHATYRWYGQPSDALKTYLKNRLNADPNWK
ncbi:inhibitor of vertebrate lysozyme family protein [Paraburkholderia hayleyella]|uniref:inhibitor of vertebrate lysozyme family protein n=1 Tax=Paraburkholderia hayleyella TaxID=2152889 RepID=UPI0012910142|nr:inhibitor of vertebrate lysozyme family protein [Paraburkholderia hayleyella]